MPYWLSLPASMISSAIQIIVSQADFSSRASCQVSTRSTNISDTPIAAASDAPMSRSSPKIHSSSSPTNSSAILISLAEIGPIVEFALRQRRRVGVCRTCGRTIHRSTTGISARHSRPGTSVAIAQSVQLILTPWIGSELDRQWIAGHRGDEHPRGDDVGVEGAQDQVAADPGPRFIVGLAAEDFRDCAVIGSMTPPARAVMLGIAGATINSVIPRP